MGRRAWRVGGAGRIAGASAFALAVGAGDGGGARSSQAVIGGGGSGAAGSGPDAQPSGPCDSMRAPIDPCGAVATGTIRACGQDSDGQPTPTGYLEIQDPEGSKTYVCATSWGASTGYWFDQPDQFMSDPQSCCGGGAAPGAAPPAPTPPLRVLRHPPPA